MLTTVGLIGDPVAHSVSPAMHNAAFAAHTLPDRYALWPTSAALLLERVASLREPQMRGANVTIPHKTAVMSLLDLLEPDAQAIGAVNTIVREADGRLRGSNTDAPGFARALATADYRVSSGRAVVLGAGGAARAVVYALVQGGIRSLVISNRTVERANGLLLDLCAGTDPIPCTAALALNDPALSDHIAHADLLVNATSIGLDRKMSPVSSENIHAHLLVVDLIYHMTPLLSAAAARSARTQDGLEMLVHQGAIAFEAWTGLAAPVDVMRQAARQALEKHR